jgi:hypothetical protein
MRTTLVLVSAFIPRRREFNKKWPKRFQLDVLPAGQTGSFNTGNLPLEDRAKGDLIKLVGQTGLG